MTSCPQVVPSLSPELSYSTDAPNEQQLKDLLDSLAQVNYYYTAADLIGGRVVDDCRVFREILRSFL